MTKKELEIAQAACCVGTIWDQYEGTEEFNEMVGKRVQHLIELVRNHLEQEQPEVDLDALVNEAFDKYSSVDGYGQISVSFNRAELYSFIKKIARK